MTAPEPLPARVERYVRTVYGPTGDRAEWARRTARALLAGEEPIEAMPRDAFHNTTSRIAAIRTIVTLSRNES